MTGFPQPVVFIYLSKYIPETLSCNLEGLFPNRPFFRQLGNRPSENFVITIGNYF